MAKRNKGKAVVDSEGGALSTSNSFEVLGVLQNVDVENLGDFPHFVGKRRVGRRAGKGLEALRVRVNVGLEGIVRPVSDSHGRGCGVRLRGSKISKSFEI